MNDIKDLATQISQPNEQAYHVYMPLVEALPQTHPYMDIHS